MINKLDPIHDYCELTNAFLFLIIIKLLLNYMNKILFIIIFIILVELKIFSHENTKGENI